MDMHDISNMRYMHWGYTYVKYRQMFSICIDAAYADGEDMRMPHICRCKAYGYAKNMYFYCFFQLRSENSWSRIFDPYHPTLSSVTTTYGTIRRPVILYVVSDALFVTLRAGAGKDRFAYSLTVVHFWKVVNNQKIGS